MCKTIEHKRYYGCYDLENTRRQSVSDLKRGKFTETKMEFMWLMAPVEQLNCRSAPLTPRLRPTTSRSKLFAVDRLDAVDEIDAARVARAIEYTRFPYAATSANELKDDLDEEEGLLLRAADLIGQLGDPNYMKKSNALFYEFEETGLNKSLGYATPADVVYKYPQFYWTSVAPQIQTAIRYLNITSSGRQWIGNLYGNVFRAEREVRLSGPQI